MRRIGVISTIVFLIAILFFSCVEKPIVKKKVNVAVNVSIAENGGTKSLEKNLNAFEDDIDKVYLKVLNTAGELIYSAETTEKHNISFNFTLDFEGNYLFKVEAKRVDGTVVFEGQTLQEVSYDQNNVVQINAYFRNGTLRTKVRIADEIWNKYDVHWASLKVFRSPHYSDPSALIEGIDLTFESSEKITDFTLYPSIYDVEFTIFLRAKEVNTDPQEWTNEDSPVVVSVQVSPSKVKSIEITVYYKTGIRVVVTTSNVDVPYIPGVKNLKAVWHRSRSELSLEWEYEENACFFIYKEMDDYYKYIGYTTNKNFTISNFTQNEYEKTSEIAVNAVLNEKESGFAVIPKENFEIDNEGIIEFRDKNLEDAIRETLEIPPEKPVTKADMEQLHVLAAYSRNISNLSGLEYAVNLLQLDLCNNQITDLTPLSGLTSLAWLCISSNQIYDISPLSNLLSLESLILSGNGIANIEPLANLSHLQNLDLSFNYVNDISPLSNLTNLDSLDLSHNLIEDISALVANPGLGSGDYVDIRNNLLDLSPDSTDNDMYNIIILQSRGVYVLYE
ncbi:Leucine Rich repeat-containing protein [Fervidobacterium changbaicum]|uniref:Leucine-rich repeat domain-containing protein n=1 Tax=Fervidobacterium changbaicum TaxID=310769 RepID=A0ABX5QTA3_9BACT|nr:leucine-rich repeat domain-containing protein [Fervidobacterium changbaicum]QAV33650.1 leucine-rich repeat domain-containing protein [Fervidobacterium changbaicum]SDH76576.1 Leucine Rich repeat-containing protein [Fervidobacterium changbaicum]